jgi:hypothetical protein
MALLSRSFIRNLLVSLGTIASVATAALIGASGTASADPQNVGGWTAGIALGAPLPEGAYFVDIALFNERSARAPRAPKIDVLANIPLIAWSTPYTILGGRLEVIPITPIGVAVGINPGAATGSSYHQDIYNSAALVGLAWDLGGGLGIGNYPGAWFPVNTDIGNNVGLGGNYWTFVDVASIAYNHETGVLLPTSCITIAAMTSQLAFTSSPTPQMSISESPNISTNGKSALPAMPRPI